jgi:hypothetical protein
MVSDHQQRRRKADLTESGALKGNRRKFFQQGHLDSR